MIAIKHANRLLLLSLVIAWGFDQLFWRQAPGISFFIFVLLCLAGGCLVTWWEGLRPARTTLWLLIPIVFFSGMTFIRMEQMTLAVSVLLTLTCLSVLVMSWRGGKWTLYSLSDYFMGFLHLAGSALARPVMLFFFHNKAEQAPLVPAVGDPIPAPNVNPEAGGPAKSGSASRRVVPVLRGILLAIPVIAVLAALLASADPVFSNNLSAFLNLFKIQNLGEYIFRGIYIVIGAYLLAGVYLHAIGPSHEEKLIGLDKPWLAPFLGWTEAVIVLGAVDLLFAFFVGIQFRYFFGGAANINTAGFTYADYARRGFNELVAVAVLSLLLFLALSSLTRRDQSMQRRSFTALGVGLLVLVGVILVSAFQRLLLYEAAYGFTRIRIYTHVFMVWVGILLAATVILELLRKMRGFAFGVALVSLGFGASLCILNVDSFIARENIARALNGQTLDTIYLVTLTDDAVPPIAQSFSSPTTPKTVKDQLGAVLACRKAVNELHPARQTWQSFTISGANARSLISLHQTELSAYPLTQVDGVLQVSVAGQIQPCLTNRPVD